MIEIAENRRTLVVVLCLAAIAVSGVLIARSWRGRIPSEKAYVDYFSGIGRVAARESARLLDGKGKVGVIYLDMAQGGGGIAQKQIDAFEKELAGQKGVALAAQLKLAPSTEVLDPLNLLTARRFVDFVQKNPGLDLVVSFVGPPAISASEAARLQPKPRVLVATLMEPVAGDHLFANGLVVAAFVPKANATTARGSLSSLDDWFKKNFEIATAPEKSKGK